MLNAYVVVYNSPSGQSMVIMEHHGCVLPLEKENLIRKSVEMQPHQMPEPTEKNVNKNHPKKKKKIQKNNVSVSPNPCFVILV